MTTKPPVAPAAKPKASADLRDRKPYRVTAVRDGLYIVTDDDQLARMIAGERIPPHARKVRYAPTGAIVTDLPAKSVPGLLAAGWIEPAPSADKEGGAA